MTIYTPGAGLPLGLPLGSSLDTSQVPIRRTSSESRGTNTPETSSSESHQEKGTRVGAKVLQRIAEAMPERDREVLYRIGEHRYLTTHQVQRFIFTNHASDESAARTARYVLQRLEHHLLVRALHQRIGGVRAGSAVRAWQLAPAGARLLRDDGAAHRTHEPSIRFLAHCLAIADVHLATRDLSRLDFVHDVVVQTEPTSWRRHAGLGGEQRWLQPDLAVMVETAEYTDRWFVEVDLGSESLPTLLRKCGQYEAYRASGMEQGEHGAFPLVLWVFTKAERAERLQHAIRRSPRLTPAMYRVATVETFSSVIREPLS